MGYSKWSSPSFSCSISLFHRGDSISNFLVIIILIFCAVLLFLTAVWLQQSVKRKKKSSGIPQGTILYSDLNVPATPLFSRRHRLTGKPDYILSKQNRCIPVEVKSGKGPYPHQNHILQLAAYCQILEDTSGEFVPEGILVYNNVPYTIPFDPKLRFELESVMKTMRASLRKSSVPRNHDEPGRCHRCSMRRYCTDILIENS